LVTASHAGDISREELSEYVRTVEVDFLAPHRPRDAGSPRQTEAKTRELLGWMEDLGRVTPVHYQEPFRPGFSVSGTRQPRISRPTCVKPLQAGQPAGAFTTAINASNPMGVPAAPSTCARRLFERLDDEERAFLDQHLPKCCRRCCPDASQPHS
jgi:hypothetical protein